MRYTYVEHDVIQRQTLNAKVIDAAVIILNDVTDLLLDLLLKLDKQKIPSHNVRV